ncbi:MAG: class I SAM-dependent methyltransferase, partial [Chloroflexi bacterium]|nr:class I SAM-dependent methyltransferase [Chloroflexota bacterium]
RTIDAWLKNIFEQRERLKQITSAEFYNDFRAYLKSVRFIFTHTELMQLHIIASRKFADPPPS